MHVAADIDSKPIEVSNAGRELLVTVVLGETLDLLDQAEAFEIQAIGFDLFGGAFLAQTSPSDEDGGSPTISRNLAVDVCRTCASPSRR
jgi:hypothetical protein